MTVAVQSKCVHCAAGDTKVGTRRGRIVHRLLWPPSEGLHPTTPSEGDLYWPCPDWDNEYRHAAEPLGFYRFAWLPRVCRNRKRRWLTWVECHPDGTFTLGNRAH